MRVHFIDHQAHYILLDLYMNQLLVSTVDVVCEIEEYFAKVVDCKIDIHS